MEYSELKSAINGKRLLLSRLTSNLNTTCGSISSLQTKRKEILESLNDLLNQKEEKDKEILLNQCSADLEKELSGLEEEMSGLRREMKEQLDYYSLDNIRSNFFKNSPLSDDTQNRIHDLKNEAYEVLSERFVKAYFNYLGRIRVSEEDFLDALESMEEVEKAFFEQRATQANGLVNSVISKMNDMSLDSSDEQKYDTATIVGMGVVTLILSVFIYPIYSVFLVGVSYINFNESRLLKEALDLLKVIEDNYMLMENSLVKRAGEEYKNKQEQITSEFGEAMAIVQQDMEEVQKDILEVRQRTLANFVFDGTEVRERVDEDISSVDHEIARYEEEKTKLEEDIKSTQSEIANLTAQYNSALENVKKRYIDFGRVGDNKLYPEAFLLDAVDPPEFFKNTCKSNIFIYKDMEAIINFIKLICVQLRCNILPSSSIVEVWDTVSSGVQFMSFCNPNPSGDTGGFSILNSTESIKESVISLNAVLQKRLKFIRVSYDTIRDYNEDMVRLDSVTENYYTIFVMNPDAVLTDENFQRLLVNGPDLGIFVYIFLDNSKLMGKGGEKYIALLELINCCALVSGSKFLTQAVDSVIDRLLEAKQTR